MEEEFLKLKDSFVCYAQEELDVCKRRNAVLVQNISALEANITDHTARISELEGQLKTAIDRNQPLIDSAVELEEDLEDCETESRNQDQELERA